MFYSYMTMKEHFNIQDTLLFVAHKCLKKWENVKDNSNNGK